MNQTVSVIIPIYNVEPYLRKCVDSVLAQSYTKLEVILVDDGSPDNCPQICDEYAKKDARVKVIHKENGGIADTRTVGLNAVSGAYVLFVDPDDYIAKNTIELALDVLKKQNADIAMFNWKYTFDTGKEDVLGFETKEKLIDFSKENFWKCYFSMDRGDVLCSVVWNKLYKREVLEGFQFPKGFIHEDEFLCTSIPARAEKIVFFNEALYFYFQRNGSIMHSFNPKAELDSIVAFLKRAEEFERLGYSFALSNLSWSMVMKWKKIALGSTKKEEQDALYAMGKDINVFRKKYAKKYFKMRERIRLWFICNMPRLARLIFKIRS